MAQTPLICRYLADLASEIANRPLPVKKSFLELLERAVAADGREETGERWSSNEG